MKSLDINLKKTICKLITISVLTIMKVGCRTQNFNYAKHNQRGSNFE